MNQNDSGPDHPELNDEAKAIWDRIAGPWDDEVGEGNQYTKYLIDPVTDRLIDLSPGETVLDIACGAGRYARRMAERGANVIGVDQSSEFLTRAVAASKKSKSESHGGFDNDATTMNTVLRRILGKKPAHPFTPKSLKY